MNPILIFIGGIIVGMVLVRVCGKCKSLCGGGVRNDQQKVEKEKRKAEIMRLFKKQEEVRNADVEKLFDVSDATATNYLSELEAEGKVVQVGDFGRAVSYKKLKG